ncbi:MAG: dTDP-glucose 4,6-dehydratase, partial [Planctomycetaceae bacterium]|nr:dTDP-glucose 4,6-dehydratase [Planctomycetaceae bacterium]
PGETYKIGGNMERTNLSVVENICSILNEKKPSSDGGYEKLIEFVKDRPGHDMRYAIDSSKIKSELGWEPSESFDSGLEKTIDWYINNAWWWQPIREGKYTGQRLGNG